MDSCVTSTLPPFLYYSYFFSYLLRTNTTCELILEAIEAQSPPDMSMVLLEMQIEHTKHGYHWHSEERITKEELGTMKCFAMLGAVGEPETTGI